MIFTVPGRIRGKGRPRFARRGQFVSTYTDAATTNSEATVKQFAAQAMNGRPPMEGPLWLSVTVWQQHPQSWSKKRKTNAVHITGKPDCDNVLKLIGDALNKIVWSDDSQVADAHIRRMFTFGAEHVEIEVGLCDANLKPSALEFARPADRKAA